MISLAMTDLLVGVLAPFNTLRFCFWELGTNMCNFITSMVVILLSASIYHFVCVNIDRLLAIKYPMTYRDPENRKKIKFVIVFCWILALLPAIPMWLPCPYDSRNDDKDGTYKICSFPYDSQYWVWWSSVTAFIIPTVVILSTWTAITYHLYQHPLNTSQRETNHNRKITLVMGVITLVFLICWWPYAVVLMMRDKHNMELLGNLALLAYTNSLLNPLIYISISEQVRESVVKVVTCQGLVALIAENTFNHSFERQSTVRNVGRSVSRKQSVLDSSDSK